ncbi:MAG: response regulator [Luteimonas sp.]
MNPRILLVEDDATSAAFLTAAIEALPARVDAVGSLAAACAAAASTRYDVWLFDANLPDGSGIGLLELLRGRGQCAPAIAHTAAPERSARECLIDAGFDDVLVKPLSTAQLQHAIRRALGAGETIMVAEGSGPSDLPVWDDAAAIAALKGSAANVQALRQLCLGELPRARDDIAAAFARGDSGELQRILHQLRASCGFVGAVRLDKAVRAFHDAPRSEAALDRFYGALQDTLSLG